MNIELANPNSMDKHLENALLKISSPGSETMTYEFRYLPNTDGSVRWLWPAQSRKAHFLKFYHSSTFRSRLFTKLASLLFTFGFSGLVGKKLIWKTNRKLGLFFRDSSNWALFTGTPGPNRKAIFYTPARGFIKIPLGARSEDQILNEALMLAQLKELNIANIEIPEIDFLENDQVILSDVGESEVPGSLYGVQHYKALNALYLNSVRAMLPAIDSSWQKLGEEIKGLSTKAQKIPGGMLSKLEMLYAIQSDQNNFMQCIAHGDFTPWNISVKRNNCAIYDWENCQYAGLGFDFFHFHFQKGILVEHRPFSSIYKDILAGFNANMIPGIHAVRGVKVLEKYLSYYLLQNVSYYLHLYEEQSDWHQQIHWLLNTWNEALSFVLRDQVDNRKLLIGDLSDFLFHSPYAILKCNLLSLDLLPENSDLDILLEKKQTPALTKYLKKHPLCKHLRAENKSYMSQVCAITPDGGMLHLDLIHDFKRKDIRFLEAKEALKEAQFNDRNFKVLPPRWDARYISLFYALNHARVPARFQAYELVLNRSKEGIDNLLAAYIREASCQKAIQKTLKSKDYNRGIQRLKSKVLYLIDTIGSFRLNKGFIISFSGVDGAGKSTMIKEIQPKIEKVLRRRVLVLRHRPSLLPILSAWRYGKVKAEQRSVESLPRMGTNKSSLGSLLRFGYYYFDYLLGQIYIHVRYAFAGYVVIYDRYYFDFIIDGLRSNIQLPESISLFLYRFITKPKLNFFLYAEPETILERKKELDRPAIEKLTTAYMNLFSMLQKRGDAEYIPLLNTDKDQSLFQIFNVIKTKAA